MPLKDRSARGSAALLVGLVLLLLTDNASAAVQAVPTPLPELSFVATVLQTIVNFSKVVELGVILFGTYQFWKGRRERLEAEVAETARAKVDAIYQAWQVINSAQGKGGSGGRIEALRDLLRHEVSLAGINLDGAWLERVELPGAKLDRASLQGTRLSHANLSGARLEHANLRNTDLVGTNLSGANLRGADLTGARLSAASLEGADLTEVTGWADVRSFAHASILGVRHAPPGFVAHALEAGAEDERVPNSTLDGSESHSQMFRAM